MSTIKIKKEDKDKIDLLHKQLQMDRGVVIGYLADQAVKYQMFESDWVDKLIEERFSEMLKEADISYRRTFEIDKHRSVLRIREKMIEARLKTLPDSDRMAFVDSLLGDPAQAGDIIDRISATQIYRVNGENRSLTPDADGKPRIVGIPPSQIVKCKRGFHTHLSDCLACVDRLTCETRKGIIVDWLAIHGTSQQQETFITSGQFHTPRIGDKKK